MRSGLAMLVLAGCATTSRGPGVASLEGAIDNLEQAGMDDWGEITDPAVRDAADAIVRQLRPDEESGCDATPAASAAEVPGG